ncbi:MAG: GNAT family N-acetyltransferase [bacterium]
MTILPDHPHLEVHVRRIHRRDLNRVWEFLELVFHDVNGETVEISGRARRRASATSTTRKALSSCSSKSTRRWSVTPNALSTRAAINPRYFEKREMRPIFVEELAVHPEYLGKGVGNFMLEQIHHLARLRGCTHVVLEVAENNTDALRWYRKRSLYKLDAGIFLAQRVATEPDLLPPRRLRSKAARAEILGGDSEKRKAKSGKPAVKRRKAAASE